MKLALQVTRQDGQDTGANRLHAKNDGANMQTDHAKRQGGATVVAEEPAR